MRVTGSGIVNVSNASQEDWLTFCEKCPHSTFFQTPFWADAFESWSSGQIKLHAQLIELNNGKKVLLPVSIKKRGWIKIALSMPASTYGGWLSDKELTSQNIADLLQFLKQNYKDLLFIENPYDTQLSKAQIFGAQNYSTSVIDLRDGIEIVNKRSKYYHRKNIKTALKAGIQIECVDDFSKWQEYFQIYEHSINRWIRNNLFSGVKYSLKLFEILHKIDPAYRKLWVAWYNGKIVSGILCFYWNKHAVAWHGAGLSQYFNFRPNNLLYQHAIEDACCKGFHWFDCNPSRGLEGVSNFKQGLGAIQLPVRVIDQRSFLRRIFTKVSGRTKTEK